MFRFFSLKLQRTVHSKSSLVLTGSCNSKKTWPISRGSGSTSSIPMTMLSNHLRVFVTVHPVVRVRISYTPLWIRLSGADGSPVPIWTGQESLCWIPPSIRRFGNWLWDTISTQTSWWQRSSLGGTSILSEIPIPRTQSVITHPPCASPSTSLTTLRRSWILDHWSDHLTLGIFLLGSSEVLLDPSSKSTLNGGGLSRIAASWISGLMLLLIQKFTGLSLGSCPSQHQRLSSDESFKSEPSIQINVSCCSRWTWHAGTAGCRSTQLPSRTSQSCGRARPTWTGACPSGTEAALWQPKDSYGLYPGCTEPKFHLTRVLLIRASIVGVPVIVNVGKIVRIPILMMLSPSPLAADNFSSFLALADHLGLRLSTTPGHISPPSTVCVALGLEYDTVANTVSLPQAKLCALVELLQSWLDKPKATERELASVAGKLLQACGVIFSGRLFLNRILATKRRAARFSNAIYLDESFRDDVQWWLEALRLRNGVSFLVQTSTAVITLDASTSGWYGGAPGIGAYHHQRHEYISVSPPEHLHELHISDLELLAHLLVARVWGPEMDCQQVKVFTDNTACFYLAQNGRSAWDHRLRMARIFATSQINFSYRVEPAWISTSDNWLADALSRPAEKKYRDIFEEFSNGLGARPVQREILPDFFNF